MASLGAQDGATDGQVGGTWGQSGANMAKITDAKSLNFLMHLGIDFLEDLGGFREGKWSHVGIKFGA